MVPLSRLHKCQCSLLQNSIIGRWWGGICSPPPNTYTLAVSRDIWGCPNQGDGCYWHLVGRGQGCSQFPVHGPAPRMMEPPRLLALRWWLGKSGDWEMGFRDLTPSFSPPCFSGQAPSVPQSLKPPLFLPLEVRESWRSQSWKWTHETHHLGLLLFSR